MVRRNSPFFAYAEPEFSFEPKRKYVKRISKLKEEGLKPHEEVKLNIEEYRSLARFDEKNKEKFIQRQRYSDVQYIKARYDVDSLLDFTSYTEAIAGEENVNNRLKELPEGSRRLIIEEFNGDLNKFYLEEVYELSEKKLQKKILIGLILMKLKEYPLRGKVT